MLPDLIGLTFSPSRKPSTGRAGSSSSALRWGWSREGRGLFAAQSTITCLLPWQGEPADLLTGMGPSNDVMESLGGFQSPAGICVTGPSLREGF